MIFVVITLAAALPGRAQTTSTNNTVTTINLGTQGRNPDFSSLPMTRPITVGTALPGTCVVGQLYFNTAAPAGSNIYGCTATNVWTVQGGGGGSTSTVSAAPAVTLSASTLSFPAQADGTTSSVQTVTLTNSGTAALSISGLTMTGTNAADFAESNNCGSTLNANASCVVAVTFAPSTASSEAGSLSISDAASGSPQLVSLSGIGTAASTSASNSPVVTPSALVATVATPLTVSANKSVTWSLAAGSTGSIGSQSGSSVVYTPPSSSPAQNTMNGCMVHPNDSVFNTRIDSLPVNANSASWVTSMGTAPLQLDFAWGTNYADNTLAATAQTFYYTTGNNGNFQISPAPARKREAGSLTIDGNFDHHMITLNHQTCHFSETYQDGDPNSVCSGCTAISGWQYDGTSYATPVSGSGGGTTDAAGLPLQPLTLHLSEIEAGSVNHALRFTLCTGCINSGTFLWPATAANGSPTPTAPPMGARFRLKSSYSVTGVYQINLNNGGSGYTSAPTVSVTGCQTAPAATTTVSGGAVQGVVLTVMGANCSNPTVSFSGTGSGASATALVYPAAAQTVLVGLQRYGMFLADNGTSGQVQTSTDVTQDPVVLAAMVQINTAAIKPANFEAVDESGLMIASSSYQVKPANGFVSPSNFAVLTATDSNGNQTQVPIAIQPVAVGVPNQALTFQAGMSAYQMTAWVNGTSNQSVTWSIVSGPGSITSAGLYTTPASVTALTPVVLKATSAADSTASASVYGSVMPAGTIRVDVGNASSYTDSQGNAWLPDAVASEYSSFSAQNDNYPSNVWGTLTDAALYQTYKYTWGSDIYYGPFVVPNGNYKVQLMFGIGGCSGTYTVGTAGLIMGQLALETQGTVQERFNPVLGSNDTCRTPAIAYIPAQVTNNLLYVAVRATTNATGSTHTVPFLNAFTITADSTPAHLSVDSQQVTTIHAGGTTQMYPTGWYMSNAVTWSVSGGGSISQTGLYTAPATSPSSSQTITITATSTVDPSITATATLTFS